MTAKLTGTAALVTGASSGIGELWIMPTDQV
jgi:NADP-dependent 3-hydroxy acid dehydrogenase YdfG